MNLIMRFLLKSVIFFFILLFTKSGFSQVTNTVGEGEFFTRKKEKSNINLALDFSMTNTDEHYNKLVYSVIENESFQVGFTFRGYFSITNKLTANVTIPYLFKAGVDDDENYPNAAEPFPGMKDYVTNHGFGDMTAGLTYVIFAQDSAPVNLIAQSGVVLAAGESRFHSTYKGYLPLGNGFHNLNIGCGVSRRFSFHSLLYSSVGYVFRFPSHFKPTAYNYGLPTNGEDYHPGDIAYLRAGIGYRFHLLGQPQVINLETEYIAVGAIQLQDLQFEEHYLAENSYRVLRTGMKLISDRIRGESASLFVGYEKSEYGDSFVLELSIPMAIRFFNYDFKKDE